MDSYLAGGGLNWLPSGGDVGAGGGGFANPVQSFGSTPATLSAFGGPLDYNLGSSRSDPYDPRLLDPNFDPNSVWSMPQGAPQGSVWNWTGPTNGDENNEGSRGFWNVDTTPQGGVNPGGGFLSGLNLGNIAKAIALPSAFQVGGASGTNIANNAISGNPLGQNAGVAAGADLTGLGLGVGGIGGAGLGLAGRSAAALGGGNMATSGTGAGGAFGNLLGGAANLAGTNQMQQYLQQAQDNANRAGQFTPYNVYSGLGSTTFGPNGVTSTLSPQYQGIQGSLLSNASGALAAGAQDPQTLANNYYSMLNQQAAPQEATDRANALAQLQATGTTGLGVGPNVNGAGPANPLYSSLLLAQNNNALNRQIQAQTMAQQVANSTQQRGLGYLSAGTGLDQFGLQNAQLGGQLGAAQTQGALGGARIATPLIQQQGALRGGVLGGLGSALQSGGIGSLLGGLGSLGGLFSGSGQGGSFGLDSLPLPSDSDLQGLFSGGGASSVLDLGGGFI
jgi:hypothetical protein